MSRKLIEKYRRRPNVNLDGCTPIQLADGQEWYFPRPMLELRPHFRDGKPVHLSRFVTHGEELDNLLRGISEAEDGATQILAVLRLGGELLLRNYDLTDNHLEQLFRYRVDDTTGQSIAMLEAIIDVASGKMQGYVSDPKQYADGSY